MTERFKSAATALLIALTTLAMTAWTWGTWSDVMMDFGRELYLAWQLSEGRTLYLDVASFNGPLSPHVNALWFRLFGVSIRSLVVGNLLVLVALIVILYSLLRSVAGRLGTVAATEFFVIVFAFGEYYDVRNYNYITPYSHEIVHGLLLSLTALRCFAWLTASRRPLAAAVAGVCLGLTFLTKPEVFVAAAGAILLGFVLLLSQRDRIRAPHLTAFVLGGSVPIVVSWLLLGRTMGLAEAATALTFPYRFLFDSAVSSLPFYARMTGLDRPGASAGAMAMAAIVLVAILGGMAGIAFGTRGRHARTEMTALAAIAIVTAGILARGDVVTGVARPLPLLMLTGAGILARSIAQRDGANRAQHVVLLTSVIFAGLLMGKVALNVRLYHYGFVLAMPASLVVVVALVDWIPGYLESRGADGGVFRALAGTAIGVVALIFLTLHGERIAESTYPVGVGNDRILADSRAIPMNAMARIISARAQTTDRLAVMPEGALLNYLTRRPGSTPYSVFLPPELVMFGENRMFEALRRHPPDYIVIVDRPMEEYGSEGFGVDYAQDIQSWIAEEYAFELAVPGVPHMAHDFGMRLFRRLNGPRTTTTR